MKKSLTTGFAILALTLAGNAQENPFSRAAMVSPDVHENGTIDVLLNAPNATKVLVDGNWMPWTSEGKQLTAMTQDTAGIWKCTLGPLASDYYTYNFVVDGVKVLDPNNAHVVRDVSNLFNVFLVPGEKGDGYSVQNVPHGTVAQTWYASPKNDKNRRLTVYTPPGYESNQETYPVLYLLHGLGGDENAWLELGRTAQILDNLIAAGKAKPMIVVMPNGNVFQEATPGAGSSNLVQPTFQLPQTMDGHYEASFDEIIAFVESQYRVDKRKEMRAIAGLSMGGYHSAYISQNYPETFDYIGLFSPALNRDPSEKPELPAYKHLDRKIKRQQKDGVKLYWIAVGEDDFPELYQGIQTYRKKMEDIGFPYEYYETTGGHTWSNWRDYLTLFAQRLF